MIDHNIRAIYGEQQVTTRCLHCNRFRHKGTVPAGQKKLQQHRDKVHPELEPLQQALQRSSRIVRRHKKVGITTNPGPTRADSTTTELREREVLRRMSRQDLPALETGR